MIAKGHVRVKPKWNSTIEFCGDRMVVRWVFGADRRVAYWSFVTTPDKFVRWVQAGFPVWCEYCWKKDECEHVFWTGDEGDAHEAVKVIRMDLV